MHDKTKTNQHAITIETLNDYVNDIDSLNDIITKLTTRDLLYFEHDDDIKKCVDILISGRQSQIDDFNDALRDFAKQS